MTAKVVAIVGASGYVGKFFTDELLQVNAFEIRILTRSSSVESAPFEEFKKRGASLHVISYDDISSITRAFEGVDVVIATVAGSALASAQLPLIKAAKAAGVKTYFPSEYGGAFENENHPSAVIRAKKTVLKAAKETGLPVTIVSNGGFPEYCLIPPLGYAFAEKKVTIWGDGNSKITWTTARSVAQWVANVLKTTPIEWLQNKYLNIQGSSFSPNDIVKLWEDKHNDKLEVDYRPLKEVQDRAQADENDFLAAILEEWHSGRGELKPLSNDLYPGWKPETVESIL